MPPHASKVLVWDPEERRLGFWSRRGIAYGGSRARGVQPGPLADFAGSRGGGAVLWAAFATAVLTLVVELAEGPRKRTGAEE